MLLQINLKWFKPILSTHMLRFYVFIFLILLVFENSASAQSQRQGKGISFTMGLYSASLLGDLGGKNADGTHDFLDLDLNQTRYGVSSGLKVNTSSNRYASTAIAIDLTYVRLSGNDNQSISSRTPRQLHVRTDIVEAAIKYEFVYTKYRSQFRGLYANVGIGSIYYEPMAQWNNTWYKLRPLGTEGQNLSTGNGQYSKICMIVPFGVGKKIELNNGYSLDLGIAFKKSFTDYLDDAGSVYANQEEIRQASGDIAAHFSNPTNGEGGTGREGSLRAKPANDNYFLLGVKLEFPNKKTYRGKKSRHKTKSWKKRNNKKLKSGRHSKRKWYIMDNRWFRADGSVPKFKKNGKTHHKF